ncbi:MAG: cytidylate kinase-like family protein [Gemmatimonadaceae bacterium]
MPVITLSRTFGSGGSLVAASVADRLGWGLLDNALVERVAVGLQTTPAYVQAIEERSPSFAERIANVFAYSSQEMLSAPVDGPLPPTEDRILEVTRRVIDEAVARGPVVLVGRGAQSRLATSDDAMHVLCVTTRSAAVARVMARDGLTQADAERMVDDTNSDRLAYVKRHWKRDWLAPHNYHLCVNTGWLGIEPAADLVVRMAKERFPDSTRAQPLA